MNQQKISLLITDFDGVMTDGSVYINDSGEETVRCSRIDSVGIHILKNAGIETIVVSSEKSKVVKERCKKLEIESHVGVFDKLSYVSKILLERNIKFSNTCFIGDEINDIALLEKAGLSICPRNALPNVKKLCDLVLDVSGGEGVIRAVAQILVSNPKWLVKER